MTKGISMTSCLLTTVRFEMTDERSETYYKSQNRNYYTKTSHCGKYKFMLLYY